MTQSNTSVVLLGLIIVAVISLSPIVSPAEPLVYTDAEAVRPLLVGTTIPGGQLKTTRGADFDLTAAVRAKPTVLIFYRGSW